MSTLKIIAKNIKVLRAMNDFSQEELEYRAGLSIGHISKIETSKLNLKILTLGKIADVFGVDIAYLLTDHSK